MRRAFSTFSWGSSSFNINILNNVEISLPVKRDNTIDYNYIMKQMHELKEERVRELEVYLRENGFEDCTLKKEEKNALLTIKEGKKNYKLFRIDELFDVATGRDIIIGRTKEGHIPLISHQHDDNGISKRIGKIENRRLFNHSTTLPLADRGVFLATTQAEDFHIGTRVKALTFKAGSQSENVRLFFVAAINKLQALFLDYLTNATDNLPNLQISVPLNNNQEIDYVYMENYIQALKKQCIARLKQEIHNECNAFEHVLLERDGNIVSLDLNMTGNSSQEIESEPLLAAEPFERYKWEGFDQSIRDFFGNDQAILVGCYKDKQYLDWIQSHNIYNIRLGKTKGSMEANRELFDSTSLMILYELGKPYKLNAYKITGHQEMSKEELIKLDYPNKKPRKNYMAFSITPLDMDLTFLVEHHLIERLVELNADHAKGTPIFIEP